MKNQPSCLRLKRVTDKKIVEIVVKQRENELMIDIVCFFFFVWFYYFPQLCFS